MERKKNRSNFKAKLKTAMFCWSYLNRQKYLPFRWILNGIWCTHEIQFMGKKTRRKSQREKKTFLKPNRNTRILPKFTGSNFSTDFRLILCLCLLYILSYSTFVYVWCLNHMFFFLSNFVLDHNVSFLSV